VGYAAVLLEKPEGEQVGWLKVFFLLQRKGPHAVNIIPAASEGVVVVAVAGRGGIHRVARIEVRSAECLLAFS
jgi:hypothetical protein